MANVNAPTYQDYAKDGPDGSDVTQEFTFTGNAAIADVIRFCTVRAGDKVVDLSVIVPAAVASLTGSVGWAYVDGSSADADAFVAASTSLATAGKVRANTGTAPIVFAKDAYLTLTTAGAALSNDTLVLQPTVQTVGL